MTVFRTATLRTFFFAIYAGAKELKPETFFHLGNSNCLLWYVLEKVVQFHRHFQDLLQSQALRLVRKFLTHFQPKYLLYRFPEFRIHRHLAEVQLH